MNLSDLRYPSLILALGAAFVAGNQFSAYQRHSLGKGDLIGRVGEDLRHSAISARNKVAYNLDVTNIDLGIITISGTNLVGTKGAISGEMGTRPEGYMLDQWRGDIGRGNLVRSGASGALAIGFGGLFLYTFSKRKPLEDNA